MPLRTVELFCDVVALRSFSKAATERDVTQSSVSQSIAALEAGLGVKLNREKLGIYHEMYRRLGNYPYDRDPGRPGWSPLVPNDRWADPKASRAVPIPY